MRSLLTALALGLLLFVVSSSFAFDYTGSRMIGWLVGAAVFPVVPLIWHVVGEARREKHVDELAAATRFMFRVVAITLIGLGIAWLIGRERVVRATTSHGWWWFTSPSVTPTPTPTPTPMPTPKPPVTKPAATPSTAPPHIARVDAGPRNVCLVNDAGTADCWGIGENGQNGDGQTTDRTVPTRVASLDHVVDIAIGQAESCALLRDGTVECWGAEHHTPAIVPNLTGVRQLGAGDAHVCALLADGTVRCWGENAVGQLGDGTKLPRAIPTQVRSLSNVTQLAVGGRHTCVRTAAGTVACWGVNDFAQLGSPGRPIHSPATLPLQVKTLVGVVDIVAGQNHTCVRLASSAVSCWGWDEECQLGFVSKERCFGGSPCSAAPTAVPGLTDVAELSLGAMHSCARHDNGSVDCWGDDPKQFLPDNTVDDKIPRACAPAATEVHTAAQIALYWGGVCALLVDNTLACWGSNWFGELGDGTKHAHPHPAPIVRQQ